MDYVSDAELEMMDALEVLDKRLVTIRAGRANPAMVSNIKVDYYGSMTPIKELANISVPEARELIIKPFDKTCIKNMEHAINEANLGINPISNGDMIIMNIPPLTEETRRNCVKESNQMGEDAKVAVRKVRQDANNKIKKDESISEDQQKSLLNDIQELTDKYTKEVDKKIDEKNKDLMEI